MGKHVQFSNFLVLEHEFGTNWVQQLRHPHSHYIFLMDWFFCYNKMSFFGFSDKFSLKSGTPHWNRAYNCYFIWKKLGDYITLSMFTELSVSGKVRIRTRSVTLLTPGCSYLLCHRLLQSRASSQWSPLWEEPLSLAWVPGLSVRLQGEESSSPCPFVSVKKDIYCVILNISLGGTVLLIY